MDKPQTLKGFRDFLPAEVRKRTYVSNTLKSVFERYGFEPLETPALEYAQVLMGKYGNEADKLLYTFLDRGGRKIGMRYDQTVPLARVVSQGQNTLPLPFKRYQIQPVWRAENTQKGRYREFVQCDMDTVGTDSLLADSEIIACVLEAVQKLGFNNLKLLINDRKNFAGILTAYITVIDKLDKIGRDGVIKELTEKGLSQTEAEELFNTVERKEITHEVKQVLTYLEPQTSKGLLVEYKPTLARGLDYYTGVIFELVAMTSGGLSLGGGGRYDNLIGTFAGKQIPAVGFAFGFDRIVETMSEEGLFPDEIIGTKVLITLFSADEKVIRKALDLSFILRQEGINTDLWVDESAKMEKQLKYADQKNIPYAVIIGPEEVEKNVVMLRNLKTREQKQVSIEALIEEIQN
jgi:histidyl-tRNA synthetase